MTPPKTLKRGSRRACWEGVYIHSEIFKVRPDVHCILHTHPTYSIAWSGTGRPFRPLSQPAALFYNAVGLYVDTINLIRSTEMGAGVAKALGPHSVVMLKNHGIVTAGPSIEEVVIRTIMFENAAQIQMIMEAAGDIAPEFPVKDIEKLKHDISRAEQFAINFDYLVRRAKRREGVAG